MTTQLQLINIIIIIIITAAICAERWKLGVELPASFPINFIFRTTKQATLPNWLLPPACSDQMFGTDCSTLNPSDVNLSFNFEWRRSYSLLESASA